jgi:hypothetical protein
MTKKTEKKIEAKADKKEAKAVKAVTPTKETKAKVTPKEIPKPSARAAVKVAWVKANGGGQPPAPLWESLTTELALGRKTDAEIRAELLKLATE